MCFFPSHAQTWPFLWSSPHFSEAMVTPIAQLCDIEDVILLESGQTNGYRRCDTVWECKRDVADASGENDGI